MARVFISYRRQDSAGHAGRIYDRLRSFFGSGRVFMDVEGIDLGADFTRVLDERIVRAEVVIAVIGPRWISVSAPDGQRRLFSDNDYVRYELATALARGIEVIPVLVAGAEAPGANELPEDLAGLANLQMYSISDVAMDAGMARLIRGVERSAARTREMRRLTPKSKSQFRERWWARLLLLYEPSHPALWLLHIPFFTITMALVFMPLIIWSMGVDGENPIHFAFVGLYSILILLVIIRAVVLGLEPDAIVGPLRRWCLLYNPPRAVMSMVHLVFLIMVLLCLFLPGALVEGIRLQSNDVARVVLVQVWISLIVLTFVVREIGASNDPLRPVLSEPNWFARFLYLWKPQRTVAWLPRIVYYAACFSIFQMLPGALADSDGNFGNVSWDEKSNRVVSLVVLAAIVVAARGAARAGEVGWPGAQGTGTVRRVRSILLLYVPWRPAGWAASTVFFVGLSFLIALLAGRNQTLELLGVKPAALTLPALAVLSTILVVCAWGWAQLYRPPALWNEPRADTPAPS